MPDAPNPPSTRTPPRADRWTRWAASPWIVFAAALLLIVPGLAQLGLQSPLEFESWDRARSLSGDGLDELVRAPWLPVEIRRWGFERFGAELGLRLPHAIAVAAAAAVCAALARRLGASKRVAWTSAVVYLAFPVTGGVAHTVGGAPIGEAAAGLALLWGWEASAGPHGRVARVEWGLLALLALAASVASTGLVLGGIVPLAAFALIPAPPETPTSTPTSRGASRALPAPSPRLRSTLILAALGLALVAIRLVLEQGEGYIPLLGAAKDLELLERPVRRELVASVESLGHALFPLTPMVVLGAVVRGRGTWPARWLAIGLAVDVLWSSAYGSTPQLLGIPAALCAAAGLELLVDARRDAIVRRFVIVVAVAGVWILARDASETPSVVAYPMYAFSREGLYPAEATLAEFRISQLARWAWVPWLLAFLITPRSSLDLAPSRARDVSPPAVVSRALRTELAWVVVALSCAVLAWHSQRAWPQVNAAQLSMRPLFERRAEIVDAGGPELLTIHRVRDRGLELYGPPPEYVRDLKSRDELRDALAGDAPVLALIRKSDYAGLRQLSRVGDWPLFLLDDRNHEFALVSNVQSTAVEAVDPLTDILFSEPPPLEHAARVRFEDRIEIYGWEIEGELKRGRIVTVTLGIKVLRPLPAGTKMLVRMQQGEMSKVNLEGHDLAEDLYPGNYWRPGDYILDRVHFEIPRINTLPGTHEFFIGLEKNQKARFTITLPEGTEGSDGVRIRDGAREFAVLAEVEIE